MPESLHEDIGFRASDGYELRTAVWPAAGEPKGHVVVLHGVQSHSGWYHRLGETLATAGYSTSFPNRRGSGPHQEDRGHAPSASRLLDDLAEWIGHLKQTEPALPVALAGISWGGKLAVLTAARHPELVDALALICPGLQPRVGVSLAEKLRIARAVLFNRRKTFPIPLADPALFTDDPEKREFIRNDPLSLRRATAGMNANDLARLIGRRQRATHFGCQPGQTLDELRVAGRELPIAVIDVVLQAGSSVAAHRQRHDVHRQLVLADGADRPVRAGRQ